MSNHVGFVVIPLWNENVISSEPWYIMQQRGTHTHTLRKVQGYEYMDKIRTKRSAME